MEGGNRLVAVKTPVKNIRLSTRILILFVIGHYLYYTGYPFYAPHLSLFLTFLDHLLVQGRPVFFVIQYFWSCAMSSVSWYFFMSPFTLSLHLFLGRPRLLLPETSSLRDFAQMWLRSRLKQWPNHFSLLFSRNVSTGFTYMLPSWCLHFWCCPSWSSLLPISTSSFRLNWVCSHLSSLRPNILSRTSLLVWWLFWRLCLSIARASSYRTSPRILPSTSSTRYVFVLWTVTRGIWRM